MLRTFNIKFFLMLKIVFQICCIKDCSLIQNVKPNSSENIMGGCDCIQGFSFNQKLQQCLKICLQINNQILNQKTPNICECVPGYIRNQVTKKCQKKPIIKPQYANINQYIKLKQINTQYIYWEDSCVDTSCPQSQIWNSSLFKCLFDCKQKQFGLYSDINNLTACVCQTNYTWSIYTDGCIRNCTADPNSIGTYKDEKTGECYCKTGYIWDSNGLNCTTIKFLASNIYVPVLIATGAVSGIVLALWPLTILLQKVGLLAATTGTFGANGLIGIAPYSSAKVIPQDDLL